MTTCAFVFARGGSKGLKRKNLRKLGGKPLVQLAIEHAQSSDLIDRIFVSTEDDEIALAAQSAGAEIIHRPDNLASDNSPEWLSWQHAANYVRSKHGCFETFISLPATSPLRSTRDIESAIQKYRSTDADLCLAVTKATHSPYFNMVEMTPSGHVRRLIQKDKNFARRQDVPRTYNVTTSVYVTSPEFVTKATGVFDGKIASIEVPRERSIDIDDIYDFMLAEAIFEANRGS